MKRTSSKSPRTALRAEYELDYSKSTPNRFAAQLKDTKVVVLQPDVARVFRSADSVNDLLRSAIAATAGSRTSKQPPATRSGGRSAAGSLRSAKSRR